MCVVDKWRLFHFLFFSLPCCRQCRFKRYLAEELKNWRNRSVVMSACFPPTPCLFSFPFSQATNHMILSFFLSLKTTTKKVRDLTLRSFFLSFCLSFFLSFFLSSFLSFSSFLSTFIFSFFKDYNKNDWDLTTGTSIIFNIFIIIIFIKTCLQSFYSPLFVFSCKIKICWFYCKRYKGYPFV